MDKITFPVAILLLLFSVVHVSLVSGAILDESCTTNADCTVANSECNTVCVCASTHFKSGTTCSQNGGFGETCLASIGDSTCKFSLKCATDNTCQCPTPITHFFDSTDNTCKPKLALEAICANGITGQCTDVNADCLQNPSNTQEYKCLCKSTHFKPSTGACTANGGFGETCLASIGDSTCKFSLKCATDNTCQCPTPITHFFDSTDNTCKPKLALDAICANGITGQCTDVNADCLQNPSNTQEYKCLCKSTHFKPSTGACTANGGFGETCLASIGDSTCKFSLKCATDNTCQCPTPITHFFDSTDNTCKPKLALDAICANGITGQCKDVNADCLQNPSNSQEYKCLCKSTYFKPSTGACTAKSALDDVCLSGNTGQCLDTNADCVQDPANTQQYKCLCKTTHFNKDDVCTAKLLLHAVCTNGITGQCDDANANCLQDPTNAQQYKCLCKTTYFNKDDVCTAKIALDVECTNGITGQCSDPNAGCVQDPDNAQKYKCLCKPTHFKPQTGACTAKLALDAICTSGTTGQCSDANADCLQNPSNTQEYKCLCKTTHFNLDGICTGNGGFGDMCSSTIGDSTCKYSLKCATVNKCQCPTPTSHFFANADNTCKLKIVLNSACSKVDVMPCSDHAVCKADDNDQNKCLCNDEYYPKNSVCKARILHDATCIKDGHKEQCTEGAECKLNKENKYACTCENGADDDNKCNGATVMKVNLFVMVITVCVTIFTQW